MCDKVFLNNLECVQHMETDHEVCGLEKLVFFLSWHFELYYSRHPKLAPNGNILLARAKIVMHFSNRKAIYGMLCNASNEFRWSNFFTKCIPADCIWKLVAEGNEIGIAFNAIY